MKLSLNNISSRYASVAALNANFQAIATAFENTVSRDGTTPNTWNYNQDLNSFRIINLGTPVLNSDAATKKYVDDSVGVSNFEAYLAVTAADALNAAAAATSASSSATSAAASATAAATSATNAAASATSAMNDATTASSGASYVASVVGAGLGFTLSSFYDFGYVVDSIVVWPTDFGSVV